MKKPVILIITDNLPDQVNGVVTTFHNIERLALEQGYAIAWITPVNFVHVASPGYPEVKLSVPWRIGELIRDIDPDYIHIATEGPVGLAANLWCWRHDWRFNTSYHTRFPEFLKKIYGVPEWITYRYLRWFHNHSGRVLTTTTTMVEELQAHGFRQDVLPWTRGVDQEVLKPTQSHRYYFFGTKPVILYVGRVSKEKGLDDLCRLQDQYHVQIVGDGPYRAQLERRYPRVEFLGYLSGTDLANAYTQADVFVFPSRNDTFGIVIIESITMGTPVAAYLVPGPQDIIEQGITGYMGPDLVQNIQQCLRLDRGQVKQASKQWTWQRCWEIFRDNLVPAHD
jgi:glycosyltransferase involved in cell wall biosynthesis